MAKRKKPGEVDRFNFDDEADKNADSVAWFDATPAEERGRMMVDAAQQIETSPAEMERGDWNLLYASLFEGTAVKNLYQYGGRATLSGLVTGTGIAPGESTWNQVRSVILTVSSQVSRSKPRARCVTTAGNY